MYAYAIFKICEGKTAEMQAYIPRFQSKWKNKKSVHLFSQIFILTTIIYLSGSLKADHKFKPISNIRIENRDIPHVFCIPCVLLLSVFLKSTSKPIDSIILYSVSVIAS